MKKIYLILILAILVLLGIGYTIGWTDNGPGTTFTDK
jgi:hypothetical protein